MTTHYQHQQIEAVADFLRQCGGYHGSTTDAHTDAEQLILAVTFAPPTGDNHHNAALCPYCTTGGPELERFRAALEAVNAIDTGPPNIMGYEAYYQKVTDIVRAALWP